MSIERLQTKHTLGAGIVEPITKEKVNEIIDAVNISRAYNGYTAILNQSSTNAPVDTVLQNTLGGDIVYTYDGVGQYTGTLANAFPAGRTTIDIPITQYGEGLSYGFNDESSFWIAIGYLADAPTDVAIVGLTGIGFAWANGALFDKKIEIRVYEA